MRLLFTKLAFRLISNCLRKLEIKLVRSAHGLQKTGEHPFSVSQLQLAIKALASYRSMIILRRAKLYQEAESAQRTFVECWLYLMDFTWNPAATVLEWWKNPKRPLSEKKFQLKQRVQTDFAKNLKLGSRQKPSLIRTFDDLSNTSVHPTREAVESAWRCAAERCQFEYGGSDSQQIANLRSLRHVMDNFRLVMHLAWFIRFLRNYVLAVEPVSRYFPKPSLFERWLESWSEVAPDHLQSMFDQVQMEYAHQKRKERGDNAKDNHRSAAGESIDGAPPAT